MRRMVGIVVAVATAVAAAVLPAAPSSAATGGQSLGWGRNLSGQAGDNTWVNRSLPSRTCAVGATDCVANPLTGVRAIAAGEEHGLALLASGTVVSWGANRFGQLGDGTGTERSRPAPVCAVGATDCVANPLTGVRAIGTGSSHSIAVLSDGSVVTWGTNASGQLGDGSTEWARPTPVRVALTGVVAVDAGRDFSLALRADGTVFSWGFNGNGQLGDGTTTGRAVPGPVCAPGATDCAAAPLTGIKAIEAAHTGSHAIALRTDGTPLAWGFNGNGELGDGTDTDRPTPGPVCAIGATDCTARPLTGITGLAAGSQFTLSRTARGTMVAWGANFDGMLGDGTTTERLTPVQVLNPDGSGPLTGVTALGAGYWHSLAARSGS